MMFADCENCTNCTENEDDTYYCERYGTDIDRVHECEDTKSRNEM